MNVIISNKADVYNYLPIDLQSKIDNIIRLNTKVYFIHHIEQLIQKERIQCIIKEIMYNYWVIFKFNLVEGMYSNNRFYLNILEGDILYFLNNKINVFTELNPLLCQFLENIFNVQITDYYDFQLKTRKYDKYLRILIMLRSLSFEELENFYFYCLLLRNDSS